MCSFRWPESVHSAFSSSQRAICSNLLQRLAAYGSASAGSTGIRLPQPETPRVSRLRHELRRSVWRERRATGVRGAWGVHVAINPEGKDICAS